MALKPLREDKELSAIPVDEPVLVELDPPATGEVVEPEPKPRVEKPLKVEKDEGGDDPVKALQKQYDDHARASSAEIARLASERDDALRDAHTARNAAAETEADLIQTGLKAAQDEQKSARQSLKLAKDTGDADAEADAVERLGRAAADIREFERAAATQASDAERRKAEAERQPQGGNRTPDVNAVIDGMQVMPAEKAWLKEHTDALTDPARKAELDGAYFKAARKGIVRGTPAYFKFIEAEMGYADEASGEGDNQQQERPVMPAAPVSRESRSVATGRSASPNQIHLSPAEREQARLMGLSDTAYAKGKLQMQQEKQLYPEKFAARA